MGGNSGSPTIWDGSKENPGLNAEEAPQTERLFVFLPKILEENLRAELHAARIVQNAGDPAEVRRITHVRSATPKRVRLKMLKNSPRISCASPFAKEVEEFRHRDVLVKIREFPELRIVAGGVAKSANRRLAREFGNILEAIHGRIEVAIRPLRLQALVGGDERRTAAIEKMPRPEPPEMATGRPLE